jgi:hypothetical protein
MTHTMLNGILGFYKAVTVSSEIETQSCNTIKYTFGVVEKTGNFKLCSVCSVHISHITTIWLACSQSDLNHTLKISFKILLMCSSLNCRLCCMNIHHTDT